MYHANWMIDELLMEIYKADCQVDIQLSYGKNGNGFSARWQLRESGSETASIVKATGYTGCMDSIRTVINAVILEAWNHAQ